MVWKRKRRGEKKRRREEEEGSVGFGGVWFGGLWIFTNIVNKRITVKIVQRNDGISPSH